MIIIIIIIVVVIFMIIIIVVINILIGISISIISMIVIIKATARLPTQRPPCLQSPSPEPSRIAASRLASSIQDASHG